MTSKEALRLLETRCRFYAQDNDELKETIENNNYLIDEVVENLEDVIYDIEVLQDEVEDLEVY